MPEFEPIFKSARKTWMGFRNAGVFSIRAPGKISDVKFSDFCGRSNAQDTAILEDLNPASGAAPSTTGRLNAMRLNASVYGTLLTPYLARLSNGPAGSALNADNYTVFACGELFAP